MLLVLQTSKQKMREKLFEARMKTLELEEKKEEADQKLHGTSWDASPSWDVSALSLDHELDPDSALGILTDHSHDAELDAEERAAIDEEERIAEEEQHQAHLAEVAEREEKASDTKVSLAKEKLVKQREGDMHHHMKKMRDRSVRMKKLADKMAMLQAKEKEIEVKQSQPPKSSPVAKPASNLTAAVTEQEQVINATTEKVK